MFQEMANNWVYEMLPDCEVLRLIGGKHDI